MAARMRSFDWSKTPLGPVENWPLTLRTAIRIMLSSRFAMWMAWGPDLTFFCNDAYAPTLGLKRTWALGSPAASVWAEIWPDIGPRIERVLKTQEATWDQGLLLFLERSGYKLTGRNLALSWPLAESVARDGPVHITDIGSRVGDLPGGPRSISPNEAIIVPLRGQPGTSVGISHRRHQSMSGVYRFLPRILRACRRSGRSGNLECDCVCGRAQACRSSRRTRSCQDHLFL